MKEEIIEEQAVAPADAAEEYITEHGKPMPNIVHAIIQSKMNRLLGNLFGEKYMFPNELGLATTPPTTPDICIYPKKKLDIRTVEARESAMPITTIEILSPSQTIEELQDKVWDIYFPAGVRSAWIVVPEMKVIQLILPEGEPQIFYKNQLHDPVTDIELSLEEIFEDLI